MLKKSLCTLTALAMLSGCATRDGMTTTSYPSVNKETAGGLLGAVGGAVAGSQFGGGTGRIATTAVGTLLGAYIGTEAGRSLDRADATYAQQTATRAFTENRGYQWQNPQNGNSGIITPTETFTAQNGSLCREYSQTINVGGRQERAFGTACQQPDGSWKII